MKITESPTDGPGFLGHNVSIYGRHYASNNVQTSGLPYLFGVEEVGVGVEFHPFVIPDLGGAGSFDFSAFTIDLDESNLAGPIGAGAGNFNGCVIEDVNGT